MPVLAGRVAVALNVTDEFRVCLAGGVETERSLDLLVLQVAVNGLGTADHLYPILLGCIVFGQHTGVGVGVVATDDDECLDVQLAQNLDALLELVFFFQLGASRTDDVETTRVAVLIHQLRSDFHVVVVNQTARAEDEAVEFVGWVERLHTVEQTRNDVVTTRSLTTRKDDTHVEWFQCNGFAWLECDDRHTIGIGEKFFDFSLIANRLSGSTFNSLHGALKCLGKLGLIGSTSFLKIRYYHCF